jgi:hypothetical protein
MRRPLHAATLAAALFVASPLAARADDGQLGASGEVFSLQSGAYAALFANPPSGWGDHPVLALDVVRDGKLQRFIVPGSDGPEVEQAPALTLDREGNGGWVVWAGERVINLIGFSAAGWGEVFEVSGDAASVKANPRLAATVDRFQVLDAAGQPVWVSRTILHLVWYDDGIAGQRVLYAPLVIEAGNVVRGNRVLDLQELAGLGAASGVAVTGARPELLQRPVITAGADRRNVAIGFLAPTTGELVSLELQSVYGELAFFGDVARAVVLDTGRRQPGATLTAIADGARAVVLDTGRRLLRPSVANLLTDRFLEAVAGGAPTSELAAVADAARSRLIEEGMGLRLATAAAASNRFVEIARSDASGSSSHLLDVRQASRRALPVLPGAEVRLLLSAHGDEASLAWTTPVAVRYRETSGGEWTTVRGIALGPSLTAEQAYRLLEQRLAER